MVSPRYSLPDPPPRPWHEYRILFMPFRQPAAVFRVRSQEHCLPARITTSAHLIVKMPVAYSTSNVEKDRLGLFSPCLGYSAPGEILDYLNSLKGTQ